jgi:hypothetical protein
VDFSAGVLTTGYVEHVYITRCTLMSCMYCSSVLKTQFCIDLKAQALSV